MLGSELSLDMANAEGNGSYLEVGISGGASRLITCRSAAPIRILNPHVRALSCYVLVSNYGGCLAFDKYISEFTVLFDSNPLIGDRFEFQPDHLDYRDPALFSGLACLLNVYMVGHQWAPLENLLAKEIDRYRQSDSQTLASIHPVQRHGYILRALANNRASLTWITDRIYEFTSQQDYLGFNPAERKY